MVYKFFVCYAPFTYEMHLPMLKKLIDLPLSTHKMGQIYDVMSKSATR